MSPPRFGITKKPTKKHKGNFNWFETAVNGGAVILAVIRDAAAMAPIPYLRQAAGMTVNIINTIQVWSMCPICWNRIMNNPFTPLFQTVRDNKADFRRLGLDAATFTAAVLESYEKSEDRAKWPGEQLLSVVTDLLK